MGAAAALLPASAPAPAPVAAQGADAIASAVSAQSSTIGRVVTQLDAIGFSVGDTRFSVWTALVVTLVIVGMVAAARLGTRFARRILTRVIRLDPAQ